MGNLNEAQHQIIMYTRSWCKTYVRIMRQGTVHNGFRIYLGGPGGRGKSFTIKLMRCDVIRQRKDRNEHCGGVMILAHKRLNPKLFLTSNNL